jgi:hypothetical protein
MAKKKAKRSTQKRDQVETPTATMYAKRDEQGQFREMDEQGRSLASDRRRSAKKKVESGYGDQGDRTSAGRRRSTTTRGTGASGAKRSSKTRKSAKSGAKRTTKRSRRGGSAKVKK